MLNTFFKNQVNFIFALDYILSILIVVPVSSGNIGYVQKTGKHFVIFIFVLMTKYESQHEFPLCGLKFEQDGTVFGQV